ncbi:N-acetyltransferase [Streptomyces fradiae]|uniref:N-acetyltransferase n=1 Tax=Streptomyces fradiae TaxID=1906 RepID=UPI0035BE30E6
MPFSVRPFRRDDRDQLTDLVNTHAAAVVPGAAVSVNTVLTSLERRPGEFVTDPWVGERATLVAEARGQVVAAAHLLHYRRDADVDASLRGAGVVEWFVHRVPGELWPDAERAADALMAACLARFARRRVLTRYADGQLPVPGLCGVPEQWPHVRALYERSGFLHSGGTEVLLLARVDDLPEPQGAPLPGLVLERRLGGLGTRLTARLDGRALGYVEIGTGLARPERHAGGGLADLTDWEVGPAGRDGGVLRWLLGHARRWLELGGSARLLAYGEEGGADTALLARSGFTEVSRLRRGWEHRAGASG